MVSEGSTKQGDSQSCPLTRALIFQQQWEAWLSLQSQWFSAEPKSSHIPPFKVFSETSPTNLNLLSLPGVCQPAAGSSKTKSGSKHQCPWRILKSRKLREREKISRPAGNHNRKPRKKTKMQENTAFPAFSKSDAGTSPLWQIKKI